MKRILALLLCFVMVFSLFGCASEKEEDSTLLVGYGRASIVPEVSMPLSGYPAKENRWFSNVLDPIYATCTAFTDANSNTVLLIQMDLGKPNSSGIGKAIRDLCDTYGLQRNQIIVSATHTHSAPDGSGSDFIAEYWEDLLQQQVIAAATEAMESRLPAEIYAGSIQTKNLNFVRHYRMEDGSIAGDNFGDTSGVAKKHMQDVDAQLQLLRFKRQGGKDVVLANFQAHPLRAGSGTSLDLTSDFIGPMTTAVEQMLDCHFSYFSGASGNVDPYSRISSENITQNHTEQGQALAEYARLACYSAKKLNSGAVKSTAFEFIAKSKHENSSDTYEINLLAFTIGDVAFVNAPYEMFCSNGQFIKEHSPFAMTFVTTYGYNCHDYIPDAFTFAYDVQSYEEQNCEFREGTGEELASAFVDMLNGLAGK